LSTQLPRNVDFYSRLGFVVVHEQQFGAASDEYRFRSWWMLRPAAAATAAAEAKAAAAACAGKMHGDNGGKELRA
jgi:hypothetical protein